jgi:hypothetical protein
MNDIPLILGQLDDVLARLEDMIDEIVDIKARLKATQKVS